MGELVSQLGIKIYIRRYDATGYMPVVDFAQWRVAMLNYIDELEPDQITNFQQHSETDEVFVLLKGRCVLFIADADEHNEICDIQAVDMQPFQLYNVRQGVYHTHSLSPDAQVLIIENRNTDDSNSPKIMIGDKERQQLVEHCQRLNFPGL